MANVIVHSLHFHSCFWPIRSVQFVCGTFCHRSHTFVLISVIYWLRIHVLLHRNCIKTNQTTSFITLFNQIAAQSFCCCSIQHKLFNESEWMIMQFDYTRLCYGFFFSVSITIFRSVFFLFNKLTIRLFLKSAQMANSFDRRCWFWQIPVTSHVCSLLFHLRLLCIAVNSFQFIAAHNKSLLLHEIFSIE